jgi:hypothetical protein
MGRSSGDAGLRSCVRGGQRGLLPGQIHSSNVRTFVRAGATVGPGRRSEKDRRPRHPSTGQGSALTQLRRPPARGEQQRAHRVAEAANALGRAAQVLREVTPSSVRVGSSTPRQCRAGLTKALSTGQHARERRLLDPAELRPELRAQRGTALARARPGSSSGGSTAASGGGREGPTAGKGVAALDHGPARHGAVVAAFEHGWAARAQLPQVAQGCPNSMRSGQTPRQRSVGNPSPGCKVEPNMTTWSVCTGSPAQYPILDERCARMENHVINTVASDEADPAMAPTLNDIRGWPATVDIPMANTALGLSRAHGYALAQQGEYPARILKLGGRYRVVTASIIRLLSENSPEGST